MEEILEESGWFEIPEVPNEKGIGILKTNERNFLQLELKMVSKNSDFDFNFKPEINNIIDFIFGEIKNIPITLYECYMTNYNKIGNKITYNFNIKYLFKGARFKSLEDIELDNIRIEIDNLNNWVNDSGFIPSGQIIDKFNELYEDLELDASFSILYRKPLEKKIKLDNFELSLSLFRSLSGFISNPFILTENWVFQMTNIKKMSFFELENIIIRIRDFLSFAIGYPTSILNVTIHKELSEILVYSSSFSNLNNYKKNEVHTIDMLLTFSDIENNFKDIMENWFKNQEKLKIFYYLYFMHFYLKETYPEGIFIAYMQTLETYMRMNHIFDGHYSAEEEYKKISENLLKCINDQDISKAHKDSLNKKIIHGNEYALRKRILNLLKYFKDLSIIQDLTKNDMKKFSYDMVNTRNYYTHYSKNLEKNAAKGIDLIFLIYKLEIIIETCMLYELGFDMNEINHLSKFHYNKYGELLQL